MKNQAICKMAFEDGTVFTGTSFGATGTTCGEAVFNTSMSGYQEILTDPSYRNQMITMTYPLIGNYGVCPEDEESTQVAISGLIVKELSRNTSNFRATESLDTYLKSHNVIGLTDVDTRAITRKLRIKGAMKAVISNEILDDLKLIAMAKSSQDMAGLDLAKEASCTTPYQWSEGYSSSFAGPTTSLNNAHTNASDKPKIVAIDCGIKRNIARNLVQAGFDVTIVPVTTSAKDILAMSPQGVFVSNGPGDPEPVTYVVETIQTLIEKDMPIFGICLGHQLLSIALGAKTFKLKFGHRGGNQPVINHDIDAVEITSQNHGFGVDLDSITELDIRPTHVNLNDNTLEGFAHKSKPIFAVQYHPEASPGPHDATYLFNSFYNMVKTGLPPQKNSTHTAQ